MNEIRLKNLVAPTFYSIHRDIRGDKHTHYWLKGGRGSGKSSFVAIEMILGMMEDENANGVALRKVAAYLKDSVMEQLWWAICQLGVSEYWERKVSVPELVYRKTGQKIIFRGADNPRKIKSSKFQKGYAKFIWYEEVDEFSGMEEIRTINQSLMRGGETFVAFYSYNPPKSLRNWVNQEVLFPREDALVHHSTYLDMPKSWLGEPFFAEAEHTKETKPLSYQHEYLGEAVGGGGQIFDNIQVREITETERKQFDRIARGLDWGYAVDPLHYTVNHYDKTRRKLYIFYEIHKRGMSNRLLAQEILEENPRGLNVVCDSAEPKSIAEICEYGISAIGAKKGADSVGFGMRWLCDLEEIIIDPISCPQTVLEFTGYEYEADGQGGFKSFYPDKNNHSIDAVRYSRELDMRHVQVK
ncbi:PBSX family phage terminase large subunit [Chakrabartyella piscis]|uniref:PBSX family phage terminase large subunit n=1 Tax=Chakrabartyella piscis TaxID=2918914 RepID=UPI002958CC8F|nr:PBSX family phage terminase large subunit [Chakrabartyella piscis]